MKCDLTTSLIALRNDGKRSSLFTAYATSYILCFGEYVQVKLASLIRMAKPSPPTTCEERFYTLDEFIALHGSELPQIVQVGKGFSGTSLNQSVETGEVLIMYKVERKGKILAQHLSSGRKLCLPRTSHLKLELVSELSTKDGFTTLNALLKLPSRFFHILENIPSFGLIAGDILQLNREPPYLNLNTARCLIVNLKDPVQVDLPLSLEGKFQALPNYGVFSIDEVLQKCSLPINARVISYGNQPTVDSSSEHARALQRSLFGNILLKREIEEEVVSAITPRKQNNILMFPTKLDISVAKCMPQQMFLSRSGAEYKQLLNAIQNEKVAQDTLNADYVYFTSDPVRRYSLEMLQRFSFPFDREQRIVTTEGRVSKGGYGFALDPPFQKQTITLEDKGIQPKSFSEIEAPPLPPKMTSFATRSHVSSKKDPVRNFDKQESEIQAYSFEINGKQEALTTGCLQNDLNNHTSPLRTRDQPLENKTLLLDESKQRDKRDTTPKMQMLDDFLSESEEPLFLESFSKREAYEPHVDVNANVPSAEGLPMDSKRKQSIERILQPTQTGCDLSYNHHRPPPESTEEPFRLREKDANQDFTTATGETATNRNQQSKEHNMLDDEGSSSDQSDEDNNNINFLDLNFPKKSPDHYTESKTEIEGHFSRDLKSPRGNDEEEQRMNGDSQKKKFFHSLTLKPRWFRQDASKPGKKNKEQVLKTKSNSMKVPPRHAASCEDILISSPREDDFECLVNIAKYLETQEKLTKALAKINRLQTQGPKNLETATTPEHSNELLMNSQETGSTESGGCSQRTESKVEIRGRQDGFSEQMEKQTTPFTPAKTLDQGAPGLPVSQPFALRQGNTNSLNQNPREQGRSENHHVETNSRRPEMPHNRPAHVATDANDPESAITPSSSSQRENGHGQLRSLEDSTRRENGEDSEPCPEDSSRTWRYCRGHFTDAFGVELSEYEAKNELKKTILQTNWSEDELIELSEILRRKFIDVNRIHVPYVNLAASQQRQWGLSMDLINTEGASPFPTSNEVKRKGMPPYVNINQASGGPGMPPYENIGQDSRQTFRENELQRLPSRSQGKPPIPTPRSERSSI